MKNILDYLDKKDANPAISYNGKEYKIRKSYKITLYFQQKNKEIEKLQKEDEDFDSTTAQFDLMFDFLEKVVGEDFVKELQSDDDLSEDELLFIFQFIMNKRAGMSDEDAAKEAQEKKSEE